jgi:hypothetical protein
MTSLSRELERALLDDALIDRLADALAERLAVRLAERQAAEIDGAERQPAAGTTARLVNAAELAHVLGVSRSMVYAHAAELGALEVGNGGRPRLRFDPQQALSAWGSRCTSEQSHASDQQAAHSDRTTRPLRRHHRMPPRLPPTGSVLAIRPRGGDGSG